MIIEIEDKLFYKFKDLMKNKSNSIYAALDKIKPLEEITTNTTLIKAREVKTQRIKDNIKETIKSLYREDMKPTRYQIHKKTKIAYATLNKYYDEILEDVESKRK